MVREKPRHYIGAELASPLVRFLNFGDAAAGPLAKLIDADERRRRASVLTTNADYQRMMVKLGTPPGVARKLLGVQAIQNADRPAPGQEDEFRQATKDIVFTLGRISLTPVLLATVRGRWVVSWSGAGAKGTEADAFFRLLELASLNLLHRVRRCEYANCQRWFFASLPHTKFHSKQCQQLDYKADPERREQRRLWARDYYQRSLSSINPAKGKGKQ